MRHNGMIKAFFQAWAARDWDFVEASITLDFTFTSPYDDHIDRETYKSKCWDTVKEIGKFEFVSIIGNGNEAFVRYRNTINGEKVQNTEHFIFEGEKLKAVVVFFGLPE
jgi:ketosteroid isomerase-like protein